MLSNVVLPLLSVIVDSLSDELSSCQCSDAAKNSAAQVLLEYFDRGVELLIRILGEVFPVFGTVF